VPDALVVVGGGLVEAVRDGAALGACHGRALRRGAGERSGGANDSELTPPW
jgi:hypothetical protein